MARKTAASNGSRRGPRRTSKAVAQVLSGADQDGYTERITAVIPLASDPVELAWSRVKPAAMALIRVGEVTPRPLLRLGWGGGYRFPEYPKPIEAWTAEQAAPVNAHRRTEHTVWALVGLLAQALEEADHEIEEARCARVPVS